MKLKKLRSAISEMIICVGVAAGIQSSEYQRNETLKVKI
jgi:hypothetical protein